jgi:hypothetical protein
MAAPINTPLAGEIWHLSIEDLFAPVQETQRLGGEGPFVINLSVSTAPITPTTKKFVGCEEAQVYQIQVTEDGRPRYRLRLGPFADEDQADAVLSEVRDLYPGALTATAIPADLRAIASLKPKTPPAKKPVVTVAEKAPVEVAIDLSAANSVLAFVAGSSLRAAPKSAPPAFQIVELPPVPEVPLELSPDWAIPAPSTRVAVPPAPPAHTARVVSPSVPVPVPAAAPAPPAHTARVVSPPVPVPAAAPAPPVNLTAAPVLTEIVAPAPARSIPVLTEMAVLKPKSPAMIIKAPAIVENLEPPIAAQSVQKMPAKPVPMVVEVFAPAAKAGASITPPAPLPAVAASAPTPKPIPVVVEVFAPKVTASPDPVIAQMRQLSKPVPVVLGVFAPIVKPSASSVPVRAETTSASKAAAPIASAPATAVAVASPVIAPAAPTVVAAPEAPRPKAPVRIADVVVAAPVAEVGPPAAKTPPPAKPVPVVAAPVVPKHAPAQVSAKPRVPPKAAPSRMPNLSQSFAARPKIFAPKNAPSSKPGAGLTSLQHVASAVVPPPRQVKELDEPLPNLESTQTIRALTTPELESEATSRWFVIQLSMSDQAFDPDTVPNLDIFSEYRLYSVAGVDQGRTVHSLRLGFFTEEIAAVAVASYLGAYYDKPTIRRVSVAERERFNHQRVEARKDVGATGKHAVIEITGDLIARRKRTSTSAKSDSSSQSAFQLNATPPR